MFWKTVCIYQNQLHQSDTYKTGLFSLLAKTTSAGLLLMTSHNPLEQHVYVFHQVIQEYDTQCGPSSHSIRILLYIFHPLWLQCCVHSLFFLAIPLFTQFHLIRPFRALSILHFLQLLFSSSPYPFRSSSSPSSSSLSSSSGSFLPTIHS